jgi:transmembrane sensor
VRFAARERFVDLLDGQALFRVAKDKARPFIVSVNGTQVRAVGTQFDINYRKHGLVVTVVEGTVAVSGPDAPARSTKQPAQSGAAILLDAGQQLTVPAVASEPNAAASAPRPQPVDIDTATAWTQRRLVFEATPLEDVAAEFNRNSERTIVIRGHDLDDFHVSGAFSSTDVQPFLRFLRAQSGVEVIEEADRIIITAR